MHTIMFSKLGCATADVLKVMEDGDLETLGRDDYGGRLTHPFAAHPKVDHVTGIPPF